MRRRDFIAGTAATVAMGFAKRIRAQTIHLSPGIKRFPFRLTGRATNEPCCPRGKAYFDELK